MHAASSQNCRTFWIFIGLGKAGDIVSVKRNFARIDLVPSGKATYVTPEAIAKFEERKRVQRCHWDLTVSSVSLLLCCRRKPKTRSYSPAHPPP